MSQEPGVVANTLEQALSVTRSSKARMIQCLDNAQLMDALKHASTILSELRSGTLGPKQYYELYMATFDALGHLSNFLSEAHKAGRHHLADLYELVQYAGNIIPRLYLMITVGSVYMGMEGAPIKEILKDMMEMSRGVQHPIRGLFLRYYLSGQTKDCLPCNPNGTTTSGTLRDSLQFTLTNFIEMNKLWVRLQHQGHSRERALREVERAELKTLVGTNLVRLSQLEGISLALYEETVLPAILEQVTQCRDVLAQEYLLEVVIQVFPDEFHLKTLPLLLGVMSKLNAHVNLRNVYNQILARLTDYVCASSGIVPTTTNQNVNPTVSTDKTESDDATIEEDQGVNSSEGSSRTQHQVEDLFEAFWQHLLHILQARADLKMHDISSMLVQLGLLVARCSGTHDEYFARIMQLAQVKTLEHANSTDLHGGETTTNLTKLLLAPLENTTSILHILEIDSYRPFLKAQSLAVRRGLATAFLRLLLDTNTRIETVDQVSGVFDILDVFIADPVVVPANARPQQYDISSNADLSIQGLLARLLHQLSNEDHEIVFAMLRTASNILVTNQQFCDATIPVIAFRILSLLRLVKSSEHLHDFWIRMHKTIFRYLQEQILRLLDLDINAQAALRLFVQAGQVADQCACEEFAYEYFVQAFTIYENSISESRMQFQALSCVTRALHECRYFSGENRDTLVTKCALHSAKLLKKPDQARAILAASHLWWTTEIHAQLEDNNEGSCHDEKRVLECLQKALKIADACMDTASSIQLFIEILNQYIYYFELGNTAIAPKYISGLIDLIKQNMDNMEQTTVHRSLAANTSSLFEIEGTLAVYIAEHLARTLKHITSRQDDPEAPQWSAVEV